MELDKFLQQITSLSEADQKTLLRFVKHECLGRNSDRVSVDFQRVIKSGESRNGYVTLRGENDGAVAERINLPTSLPLTIVDGDGIHSHGRTHARNQIVVKEWLRAKKITPGTRIRVRYDSDERIGHRPVFHLTVLSRPEFIE